MTAKKTRRSLDESLADQFDSVAQEFVFGTPQPVAVAPLPVAPVPVQPAASDGLESDSLETDSLDADSLEFPQFEEPLPTPRPPAKKSRIPKVAKAAEPKATLLSKLMDGPEKEATIRLTVDLPESMHKKLSMLSARTGKKKAVIVRMLLEEALEQSE